MSENVYQQPESLGPAPDAHRNSDLSVTIFDRSLRSLIREPEQSESNTVAEVLGHCSCEIVCLSGELLP